MTHNNTYFARTRRKKVELEESRLNEIKSRLEQERGRRQTVESILYENSIFNKSELKLYSKN